MLLLCRITQAAVLGLLGSSIDKMLWLLLFVFLYWHIGVSVNIAILGANTYLIFAGSMFCSLVFVALSLS